MHVERTWVVGKLDKSLQLCMTAHIEGRALRATFVTGGYDSPAALPPNVEQQLRNSLMASIEKELFK